MLIPLIVIIPGIVAFVMFKENPEITESFTKSNGDIMNDRAYPWLISNFIPVGIKGLIVAALSAAMFLL